MNKYHAKPVVIDNIRFHSTKEGNRYVELKTMQRAGIIDKLELQPAFQLTVNGVKIGKYIADFRYQEGAETVIEDVKGKPTRLYKYKKKLMKALHGIEILET